MDGENPQQQVPQQSIQQPVTPKPSEEQSAENQQVSYSAPENNKDTKGVRKVLNYISWTFLVVFLPITVLIFLSQDSIPGDFFYPVKRSMENVILAAASVNPATRAAFRTDLTEARFKEAQSLVVSKSNASGLSTFIDDVQSTQLEVISLKSDTERERAEEKLINKLEEYESGLFTLEAKTEQNIITYQFQEISTPASIPPTSAPNLPSPTSTFTPPTVIPTSTLAPTSIPQSSSQFQPTATLTPSPTQALTTIPTVPAISETASVQVLEQRRIAETIRETKASLSKIKKDLEEKRSEEKEKREKRNEDDKPNKEELDKESGTSNRHK